MCTVIIHQTIAFGEIHVAKQFRALLCRSSTNKLTAQVVEGKLCGVIRRDAAMPSLKHLYSRGVAQGLSTSTVSSKKIIYVVCVSVFFVGTILRFVLDRYWRSVSPRVIDVVAGKTYGLGGGRATAFVTPMEGRLLECLYILPSVFLVIGMLVWARAWREWK